jgi:hypothetical protein
MIGHLQTSVKTCNATGGDLFAAVMLSYLVFQRQSGVNTPTINPLDRAITFGWATANQIDDALSFLVANEFIKYLGRVDDVQEFHVTDKGFSVA